MARNSTVTDADLDRLAKLIEMYQGKEQVELLEMKLLHARIVDQYETPADLVTMNTKARCTNGNQEESYHGSETLTIVYPSDAVIEEGRISVLAPLGVALLGSRVGETVEWRGHDGMKRSLTIAEVVYQPEAHKEWNK